MKEFIVFFWDTITEEHFTRDFSATSKKQVRDSYSVKQLEVEGHTVLGIEERTFQIS